MTTLEQTIRKHALKNAFDYGKANPGAVVGKVIAEFPDATADMKATMKKINDVISEISHLSKSDIEKQLSNFEFAEKPKEEKKGFDVPNAVQGHVVTRFPPEPSGYPHIGHAKAACIDYEIAKQYGGRMILRFDDTNPEKESQEYVEALKEGLKWLGIEWAQESYTSDNLPKIYEAAEKLIQMEKAYICTCSQDEIGKNRAEKASCQCRSKSPAENLNLWNKMKSWKMDEGQAILRFMGNLSSENTVMRDPSLARILVASHYRQKKKYFVWPSYDLAVVVMDAIEGITHPLRTKEYELRDELYFTLFDALGYKKPNLVEISRLQIKNAPISKRLLTPLVKEKKVMGWDDPRLPTLKGLARRGILPEAVKKFVLSFGISKVESETSWEALLVENKKLLDPVARHYFFVPGPVKIKVKGAEKKKLTLKLHPKNSSFGTRELNVNDEFFIPEKDFETISEGEVFRLKDLYNVKLINKSKTSLCEFVGDGLVEKKLQWVTKDSIKCEVLVPKDLVDDTGIYRENSLEIAKGLCELACTNLKEGDMIQFERFGFCRLDKKTKTKLIFIFSC